MTCNECEGSMIYTGKEYNPVWGLCSNWLCVDCMAEMHVKEAIESMNEADALKEDDK